MCDQLSFTWNFFLEATLKIIVCHQRSNSKTWQIFSRHRTKHVRMILSMISSNIMQINVEISNFAADVITIFVLFFTFMIMIIGFLLHEKSSNGFNHFLVYQLNYITIPIFKYRLTVLSCISRCSLLRC